MIDDELLQELLGKASGLYNNGEYQGAIEAWKEALRVDPGSQKAREGIQMAILLLAGWESPIEVVEEPEPATPADGADASLQGLSRAELEIRLDQGINRVRHLLDERKFSEAVEGARSLVPIDPDSEEVQRLVEDAQQAFEAAPFIEEHLTLARELAAQDRLEEAESECRKVFALDRANPEAHTLVADLRGRAQAHERAAPAATGEPPDVGGMTVKMDLSQLLDAPPAPEESAQAAKEEPLAEPLPSDMFDFDLDLGASLLAPEEPLKAEASDPEETVAAAIAPPVESEPGDQVEIVDADTVVPPSVRLVPRPDDAPPGESWLERLDGSGIAPLAREDRGHEAAPARGTGAAPAAEASGWEQELESLNLKSGEHDIVGRNAAHTQTAPPAAVDSDLSSLLEEDLGSPLAHGSVREAKPSETPQARSLREDGHDVAARGQVSQREGADEAPPEPRSRRAVPVYFGLLGVVLLAAGGTAWWFFFQPRTATGRAPSAVTPPSASSGEKPGVEHGPIPTPIGSTSKQPAQAPSAGLEPGAAAGQGSVAGVNAPATAAAPALPSEIAAAAPTMVAKPRPKTPEELRGEVAHHMSEGRRLLAGEKWREARDEFAAVLALDPVNFQGKELLDKAQEHVDQDTKVGQALEEARSAFTEKNYQGALWKLYRLPRDARLGNIDLYIRNAWFNWAVIGLKGGDATNAIQRLTEVLSIDPDDAEALELQEIAERYASKPKDKIFFSFVDTLKPRAFDQK